MKTNAARILDSLGIPYELRTYEVDSERPDRGHRGQEGRPAAGAGGRRVARGDRHGVCFAVVPGNAQLDLKAMARLTGDRKVDTVPLKEVQPLTGYVRGGVTALGAKKAYPVYADDDRALRGRLHLGRRARHADPRRSRRLSARDQGEGRRHRVAGRRRGLN